MSCLLSPEWLVRTCGCLSQPISPAHPRARHLLSGDRGGKECIQHSQHLHQTLLIVDLPLDQVLETLQLVVHHWRLADYGTIDVKEHLGCYYQDRRKPAVSQIPGEERNKKFKNDFLTSFELNIICTCVRVTYDMRKLSKCESPCSSLPARAFFKVPLRSSSFMTATVISGFLCLTPAYKWNEILEWNEMLSPYNDRCKCCL